VQQLILDHICYLQDRKENDSQSFCLNDAKLVLPVTVNKALSAKIDFSAA
jgi:hypothetical protein